MCCRFISLHTGSFIHSSSPAWWMTDNHIHALIHNYGQFRINLGGRLSTWREPTHRHGKSLQTPHGNTPRPGIKPRTFSLRGYSGTHCNTMSPHCKWRVFDSSLMKNGLNHHPSVFKSSSKAASPSPHHIIFDKEASTVGWIQINKSYSVITWRHCCVVINDKLQYPRHSSGNHLRNNCTACKLSPPHN